MSNGLRVKDICNCDQALTYREALVDILAEIQEHQDATKTMAILELLAQEALDHPEAE